MCTNQTGCQAVKNKIAKSRPPLEVCDSTGRLIEEGDIVIGYRAWMAGDGYLPKAFPEKIRVLFRVEWNRMRGRYTLTQTEIHPEDLEFSQRRTYRSHEHKIEVSPQYSDTMRAYIGGTYREDMVCERLTIYAKASDSQKVPVFMLAAESTPS